MGSRALGRASGMSAEEQELTDALKKLSPEDLAKLKTALGGTKVVVAPRLGEGKLPKSGIWMVIFCGILE